MAWIALQDTIWSHHKTLKLAELLGTSEVEIVGHLVSLWHFTMLHKPESGDLSKWGEGGIEHAARWDRDHGDFVKALRKVGLLDEFTVHAWDKHTLPLIASIERRLRQQEQTRERVRKYRQKQAEGPRPHGSERPSNAPVTLCNAPTQPNQPNQPTQRNRRGALRPAPAPVAAQPLTEAEKARLKAVMLALDGCLKVRLKAPGELIQAWLVAYPNVDIALEIRKADAWGVASQITRSPKGWARTMTTWLGKEQDRARATPRPLQAPRQVGAAAPVEGKYRNVR